MPGQADVDRNGLLWGLLGVTAFSFTVVFTRFAVTSLSPLFIGCGRAVVAATRSGGMGGLLSRELGPWQTISWALLVCSPVMVCLTLVSAASHPPHARPAQWAAFAYLGVVGMYLAFFAWYRGLAIGPMAQVSQVQLEQPILSICWAMLLLNEGLTWQTAVGALAVIACAWAAVRVRAR